MLDATGPEGRHGHDDRTTPPEVPDPPFPDGPVLPGETTVPAWTGIALLLGLIAASGSVVALGLAATAVTIAWLVSTGGDQVRATRGAPPPPFGSATGWY